MKAPDLLNYTNDYVMSLRNKDNLPHSELYYPLP